MPNKENIEKHKYKTGEKRAAENGRIGGLAGAITKQRNKDIRVALESLLEKEYNIKDPDDQSQRKDVSGAEALALVMMNKALRGDVKAWEIVRDTAGQSPKQTHGISFEIENLNALADMLNSEDDD